MTMNFSGVDACDKSAIQDVRFPLYTYGKVWDSSIHSKILRVANVVIQIFENTLKCAANAGKCTVNTIYSLASHRTVVSANTSSPAIQDVIFPLYTYGKVWDSSIHSKILRTANACIQVFGNAIKCTANTGKYAVNTIYSLVSHHTMIPRIANAIIQVFRKAIECMANAGKYAVNAVHSLVSRRTVASADAASKELSAETASQAGTENLLTKSSIDAGNVGEGIPAAEKRGSWLRTAGKAALCLTGIAGVFAVGYLLKKSFFGSKCPGGPVVEQAPGNLDEQCLVRKFDGPPVFGRTLVEACQGFIQPGETQLRFGDTFLRECVRRPAGDSSTYYWECCKKV